MQVFLFQLLFGRQKAGYKIMIAIDYIRPVKHLLLFFFFLSILSCNYKTENNSHLSVKWSAQTDSLLHDSAKINPIADSLRVKIINAATDSAAISALNELAENIPDKRGIALATEALEKSRQIKSVYLETDALTALAINYNKQAKYRESDSLINISLFNSQKYKYKKTESKALFWLGENCRMQDENSRAQSYFNQSLDIANSIKDQKRVARCFASLGTVNFMIDNDNVALLYQEKALKIAEKIKDKNIQILGLEGLGEINRFHGKYDLAISFYDRAIRLATETNDQKNIAYCLSSKGEAYRIQNDSPKALNCFNQCLQIAQKSNDSRNMSFCLKAMGNVYYNESDYVNALEYFNQSLKIFQSLKDKNGISGCLRMIGEIYRFEFNYPLAIKYHQEALDMERQTSYNSGMAFSLISLGNIYGIQSDNDFVKENFDPKDRYTKAYACLNEALQLSEKLQSNNKLASSLRSLGEIHFLQKQYPEAASFGEKSLVAAKTSGVPDNIASAAELLYRVYDRKGQPAQALYMYKLYIQMKDSMSNDDEIKKFASVEYKGKEERLKAEQTVKEQTYKLEQEKKEQEIKNQKIVRNTFITAFLLLGILAFVIFRNLQQNKKAKAIIEEQKQEVENQKELVEEKQKEIIDSISYAKRLQRAILPSVKLIRQHFSDSFVFYRPKDIVAGDFYWMEQFNNEIFIAAADCTGHGVPGAMVSVVCSNALNRSVKEFGLRDTGAILDKTRELVVETFDKSGENVKDGMDISLLRINKNKKEIQWSGANNPLWYIVNGKMQELKGDKQPVGKHEMATSFISHSVAYADGIIFYLLTDGYADQFGGAKGKKYKYKQLKELLTLHSDKPMEMQNGFLSAELELWKGPLEQVDDVTIIGIRL